MPNEWLVKLDSEFQFDVLVEIKFEIQLAIEDKNFELVKRLGQQHQAMLAHRK